MKVKTYSFKKYELTDKIRKEMLSKVDMEKLEKLFIISSGIKKNAWDKRKTGIDKKSIQWYLDEWVKNKYLYYIAMKRNLKVTGSFESSMTDREFYDMRDELAVKYDKYSSIIYSFDAECFRQNRVIKDHMYQWRIESNPIIEEKYKKIPYGMKLSKFMSKIVDDAQFDIDLSIILQNRKVTQDYYISIDPVDYLSCSFTKEKWVSCYHVGFGCFKVAPFSFMTDNVTLVAYSTNNKVQTFNSENENFHAIDLVSKRFREFITVNQGNLSFNFHQSQGQPPQEFYDIINDNVKNILDYAVFHGHCHNPIEWKTGDWHGGRNTESSSRYDHLDDDYKGSFYTSTHSNIEIGYRGDLVNIFYHTKRINTNNSMTKHY